MRNAGDDMRIEQLRCFLEVARTGSITGAAQQLYISQQSASQNVKQLEQELGCDLLVRGKNGVGLTPFGKEVAESAKKILAEQDDLQQKLNKMKANQVEEREWMYRIVSTSPVTNIVLPRIISEMDAKSKKMNLHLSMSENVDDVIDRVRDGACDIGLLTFNEQEMMKKFALVQDEIHLEVLARDEIVGVIDKKHYKGRSEYLTSEERQQYRTTQYNIIPAKEFDAYIGLNGHIINFNDAEFHRNMLEIGALVMMPELAYEYFFKNKRFIALPMEDVTVPLIHAAIYRKDTDIYLKEFVAKIRKEMYVK